ncbi:4847_t:CDS:2 [Gigaspora rosea]|nr:4847_t:CDS:2 [Gigaspora rosea]
MNNESIATKDNDFLERQKRKFNIMKLKEEWEMAEKSLRWRKNLIILNIVASLIALFLGAMLIYIEVKHLANTTFRIITSSVAGAGAILSLFNVIYERLKSNGDTIKELIKATKDINSDQKFVPLLIDIPDQLLNDKLDEDCQKYLKFLERINELIKEEKKLNAIFIVLASFYIILTSVISILINIDIIPHNSEYDDLILAISIIVIGWKWFAMTILSKFERKFEKWMNYSLKPQEGPHGAFYFCLKTAFVGPIAQAIFAILLKPSGIYYCLSNRLYLVNRYYSKKNIEDEEITEKINLEKVDPERITFFEYQKIKIDPTIKNDQLFIVDQTIKNNQIFKVDQKIRFFGTREEMEDVYFKGLEAITGVNIVYDKSRSSNNKSSEASVNKPESKVSENKPESKASEAPKNKSNNESSEGSENNPESKVSEASENKLIIKDNLGLIEKYITPAFISINVDTKYQIMIESIEITKTQKEELRSILCGISTTA